MRRILSCIKLCVIPTLLVSGCTILMVHRELPYYTSDSEWYIALAEGNLRNVISPFSERILMPVLVRFLSSASGLGIQECFFLVGLAALITLVGAVAFIWRQRIFFRPEDTAQRIYGTAPFFLVCNLFTPFLIDLFRGYFLPDLFHAALVALFLGLLMEGRILIALPVLFFLQMTRESTILLSLFVIGVALHRRDRQFALGALVATLLGWFVTSVIAKGGQTNVHHLNGILYLIFKIPFNTSKNILGIELWANTLAWQTDVFKHAPLITIDIPTWLHLGMIRKVGIYQVDPSLPLQTLAHWLTLFGVAPTAGLFILYRNRRSLVEAPIWVVIGLLYGLASFLIGPMLGASVNRLIGYGWPAFWLAVPFLASNYRWFPEQGSDRSVPVSVRLLIWQVSTCWLPWGIGLFNLNMMVTLAVIISGAMLAHYMTVKELRSAWLHTRT